MERKLAVVLAVLFLTGFVVRAFPVNTGYHYWDETVYLQHGEIVAGERTNNYDEFDFRPPLMGVMLGLLFVAVPSLTAAHILLAFLSALTIALTFLLGRRLFNHTTGLLAAVGVLVSVEHIIISHDILVDAVLPVLWLGSTLALLWLLDTGDRRWAAATGVLAGLALLLKFTSLVLLPGLLLVYGYRRWRNGTVPQDLLRDRTGWTVVAGFVAAVAPYLLWSWVMYGSPVHVFVRALQLSGAADPMLTYVTGLPQVVVPPFLLGLLLLPRWFRERQDAVVTPLILALVLLLPLQFVIGNRELRFMLPVMPFLVLMGAAGLERLRAVHRYAAPAVLVLLLLPGVAAAWNTHDVYELRTTGLTVERESPTHDAALWLRDETGEDAIVYANYQWPPVAYYSRRELVLLPVDGSRSDIMAAMDRPGYVFASTAIDREPTVSFMAGDDRFTRNRSFEETAHVFYYGGR